MTIDELEIRRAEILLEILERRPFLPPARSRDLACDDSRMSKPAIIAPTENGGLVRVPRSHAKKVATPEKEIAKAVVRAVRRGEAANKAKAKELARTTVSHTEGRP